MRACSGRRESHFRFRMGEPVTALDALLTAGEASTLLGVTGRQVRALAAAGKIPKACRGRYRLGDLVPGYLATLAAERQRQAGGAADTDFRRLRSAELSLRLDERSRRLDGEARAAAQAVVDEAGGALRSALAAVPARVTRDLTVRARIELEVNLALNAVADRLDREAARLAPPVQPAPPPTRTDARRLGRGQPGLSREQRPAGAP